MVMSAATRVAILPERSARIKVKTYVVPFSHDMFFPPDDCEAEQKLIPNSKFPACRQPVGAFRHVLHDQIRPRADRLLHSRSAGRTGWLIWTPRNSRSAQLFLKLDAWALIARLQSSPQMHIGSV